MPEIAPGTLYNPFLHNGTDTQLQTLLLTGIVVAGKTARPQQEKLARFLAVMRRNVQGCDITFGRHVRNPTPFEALGFADSLYIREQLEAVRMGQYARITPAFIQLGEQKPDLRAITRDQLCGFHGLGMKTASFFLLFTRVKAGLACLDVHILRYMRELNLCDNIPNTTPGSRRKYLELEKVFLNHCQVLDRDPAELDFEIWLARNRGDK
jgi:8-oxoguanine DNA glycosylase-like protein